jgi:hypothetical protein
MLDATLSKKPSPPSEIGICWTETEEHCLRLRVSMIVHDTALTDKVSLNLSQTIRTLTAL